MWDPCSCDTVRIAPFSSRPALVCTWLSMDRSLRPRPSAVTCVTVCHVLCLRNYATFAVTERLASLLLRSCIATCDVWQRRCAVRCSGSKDGGGGLNRGGEGEGSGREKAMRGRARQAPWRAQRAQQSRSHPHLCGQGPSARQVDCVLCKLAAQHCLFFYFFFARHLLFRVGNCPPVVTNQFPRTKDRQSSTFAWCRAFDRGWWCRRAYCTYR